MKVKLRKNVNPFPAAVNRCIKYRVVYHSNSKTIGMDKILQSMEEYASVKAFLDFLARDIKNNPSNIQPLTEDMFHRASLLTEGMEVDLDEELPEDFILA
jgi:antitoxin PrlF